LRPARVSCDRGAQDSERIADAQGIPDNDVLPFERFMVLKEPHHLADDVLGQFAEVAVSAKAGSPTFTGSSLSSMPLSSSICITPIARASTSCQDA
jgi:hypothetical protein